MYTKRLIPKQTEKLNTKMHVLCNCRHAATDLKDSGRELHEVLTRRVEGVGHGHELVLDPRLGVDLGAKPVDVKHVPESGKIVMIFKIFSPKNR
jgi:hypothetical protein